MGAPKDPEKYKLWIENISNSGRGKEKKPFTKERKLNMSKAKVGKNNPMYNKNHTEESKQKIRESTTGEKNHFYNKHHTEETKQKMRIMKEGFVPYNKGKTKENCEGIRKYTEKRKGKPRPDIRGKLNHNWKDGITPLYNKLRNCLEYRIWRDDIFTRDDFVCQECNKRGSALHAHHIKSFSDIIELNNIKTFEQAIVCSELWSINNGITLCKKCHKEIHSEIKQSID